MKKLTATTRLLTFAVVADVAVSRAASASHAVAAAGG